VNIVSSFLRQLILRLECECTEIHELQKKFRFKGKRPELGDLVKALISVSRKFRRTYAIFDALDECEANERVKLLSVINQLSDAGVKIYATCRPHLRDVRHFFTERDACCIKIVADTDDIKNFLRIRLEERTNHSSTMKAKIIDKLSLSARGVFVPLFKKAHKKDSYLEKPN
jgi:hypothetical protein